MMTTRVAAVYEQGVLRLEQPLELADGARVEVIVLTSADDSIGRTPGEIMAAIAALPLENDDISFSGRDHDRILYGNHE